jgi:hypothetical protein
VVPHQATAPTDRLDTVAEAELRRSFDGELIRPGDPDYERQRRVWNGSIDRRPALIAACTSRGDVTAALRFARRTDALVAVRSGGHSFPGLSVGDGAVVIDLRAMRGVVVDAATKTVRAQAGVLLGELDRATQAFGLAVPVGSVTHTGLAGLTLGGGFGWLMRKHGLAIDRLTAVDLVTAEGAIVRASEVENPDLFWGLRGGGGNFGIATGFAYRLVPVGPIVVSGLVLWPLGEAPQIVRHYRDWAAAAPDDLTTALVLRRAPAIDGVPPSLQGRPVIGVACCWVGPIEDGERILMPMRRYRDPEFDGIARRPFVEQQAMFDASYPPGIWVYSKATNVQVLSDDVLDVLIEHAHQITSGRSGIIAWQLGGAVAQVGEAETPFGGRSSGYLIDVLGATDSAEGFERERGWARACWEALAAHHAGVYVNWLMDEGKRRVREAYGEERFGRLQALKRRYDPDNVFRLNQNIPPA